MGDLISKPKVATKIDYLYISLFSRSATPQEQKIAMQFLGNEPKFNDWSKYTLALLNSPEFYFIK